MFNGFITSYTVNLLAVSSDAGGNRLRKRRRRQAGGVVAECVMRNGGSVESNTAVDGDQTFLTLTNLGKTN
jgi:hypothetical protein